jgi:hypothetical protein
MELTVKKQQQTLPHCLHIHVYILHFTLGTIFMYGQTGCGKTFTMLGQRQSCEQVIDIKREEESNSNNSYKQHKNSEEGIQIQVKQEVDVTFSDDRSIRNACDMQKKPSFDYVERQSTEESNFEGVMVLAFRDIFETLERVRIHITFFLFFIG